jgi:hypothetical protein
MFTLRDNDSRTRNTAHSSGVACTNFISLSGTMTAFGPVYHFVYFRITSEADFNALFIPGGHSGGFMMSNAANADITAHGGYPSFLFAGEEDLPWKGADDWNELVFAAQGVSTPEPATWTLLGFASLRSSRRGERRGLAGPPLQKCL